MWSVHKTRWATAQGGQDHLHVTSFCSPHYYHPRHIPDKCRWTQIHRNGNPLATVVLHRRSSKVPLSCLQTTAMPSVRSTNRPRAPGRRAIGARYVVTELVRNLAEGPSLLSLSPMGSRNDIAPSKRGVFFPLSASRAASRWSSPRLLAASICFVSNYSMLSPSVWVCSFN